MVVVDRASRRFLALSLTPALCATLLKPVEAGHHHAEDGLLRLVQPRLLAHGRSGYEGWSRGSLKRTGRFMLVYAAI